MPIYSQSNVAVATDNKHSHSADRTVYSKTIRTRASKAWEKVDTNSSSRYLKIGGVGQLLEFSGKDSCGREYWNLTRKSTALFFVGDRVVDRHGKTVEQKDGVISSNDFEGRRFVTGKGVQHGGKEVVFVKGWPPQVNITEEVAKKKTISKIQLPKKKSLPARSTNLVRVKTSSDWGKVVVARNGETTCHYLKVDSAGELRYFAGKVNGVEQWPKAERTAVLFFVDGKVVDKAGNAIDLAGGEITEADFKGGRFAGEKGIYHNGKVAVIVKGESLDRNAKRIPSETTKIEIIGQSASVGSIKSVQVSGQSLLTASEIDFALKNSKGEYVQQKGSDKQLLYKTSEDGKSKFCYVKKDCLLYAVRLDGQEGGVWLRKHRTERVKVYNGRRCYYWQCKTVSSWEKQENVQIARVKAVAEQVVEAKDPKKIVPEKRTVVLSHKINAAAGNLIFLRNASREDSKTDIDKMAVIVKLKKPMIFGDGSYEEKQSIEFPPYGGSGEDFQAVGAKDQAQHLYGLIHTNKSDDKTLRLNLPEEKTLELFQTYAYQLFRKQHSADTVESKGQAVKATNAYVGEVMTAYRELRAANHPAKEFTYKLSSLAAKNNRGIYFDAERYKGVLTADGKLAQRSTVVGVLRSSDGKEETVKLQDVTDDAVDVGRVSFMFVPKDKAGAKKAAPKINLADPFSSTEKKKPVVVPKPKKDAKLPTIKQVPKIKQEAEKVEASQSAPREISRTWTPETLQYFSKMKDALIDLQDNPDKDQQREKLESLTGYNIGEKGIEVLQSLFESEVAALSDADKRALYVLTQRQFALEGRGIDDSGKQVIEHTRMDLYNEKKGPYPPSYSIYRGINGALKQLIDVPSDKQITSEPKASAKATAVYDKLLAVSQPYSELAFIAKNSSSEIGSGGDATSSIDAIINYIDQQSAAAR